MADPEIMVGGGGLTKGGQPLFQQKYRKMDMVSIVSCRVMCQSIPSVTTPPPGQPWGI